MFGKTVSGKMIRITAVAVIAAVTAVLLLRGRNVKLPAANGERTLLLSYTERTVATVGGDSRREYALYRTEDGGLELHFTAGEDGTHVIWQVPEQAALDAYALISRYGMANWNERPYSPGPDGRITGLGFLTEDGMLYVSSDHMPDGGLGMMGAVRDAVTAYASEETLLTRTAD